MFKEAFVKVIKTCKANQKFEVEGDFNINYDIILNNANHINIVCSQLGDKPSRICQISGTGTVIDIDSTLINYVLPKIIQDDISDYMPI